MNKPLWLSLALGVALTGIVSAGPTQAIADCIITVSGSQYNVTKLRTTHPGGDIYVCGTDMTAIFNKQHGTDLNRIKPYLISKELTATKATAIVEPVKQYTKSTEPRLTTEQQTLMKKYNIERQALDKKHRQEMEALRMRQDNDKKALQLKYKSLFPIKPDMKKLEIKNPGVKKPDIKKPEVKRPVIKKPEINEAETDEIKTND